MNSLRTYNNALNVLSSYLFPCIVSWQKVHTRTFFTTARVSSLSFFLSYFSLIFYYDCFYNQGFLTSSNIEVQFFLFWSEWYLWYHNFPMWFFPFFKCINTYLFTIILAQLESILEGVHVKRPATSVQKNGPCIKMREGELDIFFSLHEHYECVWSIKKSSSEKQVFFCIKLYDWSG